jgi:hypothetical protein
MSVEWSNLTDIRILQGEVFVDNQRETLQKRYGKSNVSYDRSHVAALCRNKMKSLCPDFV